MKNSRAVLAGVLVAFAIAGCTQTIGPTIPVGVAIPRATATRSVVPVAAAFGTPKRVTDAQGHPLTIVPVKAWWLPGHIQSRSNPQAASEGLSPAEHGRFLIIEMKVEADSSAGADFPAPITGAGPVIISGRRMFTDAGTNASNNVVWSACLPSVDSGVTLQPGARLLQSETYDVPRKPAILAWLAGTQTAKATIWQVPAHSTGPLPAKVRTAIRTGNGC